MATIPRIRGARGSPPASVSPTPTDSHSVDEPDTPVLVPAGVPSRPSTDARSAGRLPLATVCVVAITGFTLWLRYRGIGISSLWLDDAWVGVGAKFPAIRDTIGSGLTSPGFSLIYRGWASAFGSGATTAQLLALGSGVAGPVVLFLAAEERGLPPLAGLLGAGLLAAAPDHISQSTHLKQYTAEAFVTTVVLWAAWRVIERPGASGRWVHLSVAAIAAGLLSGLGALVAGGALAVCIVAMLLARPRRLRPGIIATCVYLLVVGPWTVFVVRPNVHEKLADYWQLYFLDKKGFAGGLVPLSEAVARGFQHYEPRLVLCGLAIAAVIVLARRPLVGVLLVTPTLMAIALAALRIAPLGTGRTDIYLYPTYALLVAVAVAELGALRRGRWRWRWGMNAVTVAGLVAVALAATPATSIEYPREDLTPLVRHVEQSRQPGDEIVVYPSAGYAYGIATRYSIEKRPDALAPTDWAVKVRGPDVVVLRAHRQDPAKWGGPLDQLTARKPRIWLIGSHLFPDWDALVGMLQSRHYQVAKAFAGPGARLLLFVPEPPGIANPLAPKL